MTRKLFMRNDPAVVKAAQSSTLEEFLEQFKDATSVETLTKAYNEIRKKAGLPATPAARSNVPEAEEPLKTEGAPKTEEKDEQETPAAEEPGDKDVSKFTAEDGGKVTVKKKGGGKTTVVEVEEPIAPGDAQPGTEDNSDEVAAAKKGGKAVKEKKEKTEASGTRRTPEEMAAFKTEVLELIAEGKTDGAIVKHFAGKNIKTYPPQIKGIRDAQKPKAEEEAK